MLKFVLYNLTKTSILADILYSTIKLQYTLIYQDSIKELSSLSLHAKLNVLAK